MPTPLFSLPVRAAFIASILIIAIGNHARPVYGNKTIDVAILIFDGVELLDFAGPAEVFIVANQRHPFRVFTVAPSTNLTTTMGGIKIKPDYSFQDAPPADVVVIPGGKLQSVKADGVRWIRESAESADVVMSVCFGALLLAEARLLDGVTATTHRWAIESLKTAAPGCNVVTDRRVIDAGKIVTTGGVTSGIDGALHLVERLAGTEVADWTAQTWMEYRRTDVSANQSQADDIPSAP